MRAIVLAVALLVAVVMTATGCTAPEGEGEAQFDTRYSIEHRAYLPLDDPYWQEKEAEEAEVAPEAAETN